MPGRFGNKSMHKTLVCIVIFLLSLAQFSSLSKGGGLNIYLFDIGVGSFAVFGLSSFLLQKKVRLPSYLGAFFVFFVIAVLSFISQSHIMLLHIYELSYKRYHLLREGFATYRGDKG